MNPWIDEMERLEEEGNSEKECEYWNTVWEIWLVNFIYFLQYVTLSNGKKF